MNRLYDDQIKSHFQSDLNCNYSQKADCANSCVGNIAASCPTSSFYSSRSSDNIIYAEMLWFSSNFDCDHSLIIRRIKNDLLNMRNNLTPFEVLFWIKTKNSSFWEGRLISCVISTNKWWYLVHRWFHIQGSTHLQPKTDIALMLVFQSEMYAILTCLWTYSSTNNI